MVLHGERRKGEKVLFLQWWKSFPFFCAYIHCMCMALLTSQFFSHYFSWSVHYDVLKWIEETEWLSEWHTIMIIIIINNNIIAKRKKEAATIFNPSIHSSTTTKFSLLWIGQEMYNVPISITMNICFFSCSLSDQESYHIITLTREGVG